MLALSERSLDGTNEEVYNDLHFTRLVGLADPPRTEVRDTIAACRRAGVRVVISPETIL